MRAARHLLVIIVVILIIVVIVILDVHFHFLLQGGEKKVSLCPLESGIIQN